MPEDGSAMAKAITATSDIGSAVADCFCEYLLGIKSFIKSENKPMGQIAYIPEI